MPEGLNLIGNDYVQDESEEVRRPHTELKKKKNEKLVQRVEAPMVRYDVGKMEEE